MIHALEKSKKQCFNFENCRQILRIQTKQLVFIRNNFVFKRHVSCQLEIKQQHFSFCILPLGCISFEARFECNRSVCNSCFGAFIDYFRPHFISSQSLTMPLSFLQGRSYFLEEMNLFKVSRFSDTVKVTQLKNSEVLCFAPVLLLFSGKLVLYISIT